GLPGVALGAILGGMLRMQVERAALGRPITVTAGAGSAEPAGPRWSAHQQRSLGAVATDAFATTAGEESSMNATAVSEQLTAQRNALLAAITGLSEAALDRKGVVGDWSIKNTLAHLTDWEEVVTRIMPERARTGTYPEALRAITADEDAYNTQTISSYEHLTPQEQLAALTRARTELLEMIHGLGDEGLARTHPWPERQGALRGYFLSRVGE